jgi:hypothetical protein
MRFICHFKRSEAESRNLAFYWPYTISIHGGFVWRFATGFLHYGQPLAALRSK